MNEPLRIFIGWDSREPAAFSVLAHSILTRATCPVAITPLTLQSLQARRLYTRVRMPDESTEFSLTRFLVPYLCDYKGLALFMDCDMICKCDIADLLMYPMAHPDKAVFCCQHDYVPKSSTKFLGQAQTAYPRKNWSSLMLFRNEGCYGLTPDFVNLASPQKLQRFQWPTNHPSEPYLPDDRIGALPLTCNWLVGEYDHNDDAQILHYTLGTPLFPEYMACDHASDWWAEHDGLFVKPVAV